MNETTINMLHSIMYEMYESPRSFEQALTDTLLLIIQKTEQGEEKRLRESAFLIEQLLDLTRTMN